MALLVVADHDSKDLAPGTARTLTAARQLDETVDILIAGEGVAQAADRASRLQGARRVLVADHACLRAERAEIMQELILPLMTSYTGLLAPATTRTRAFLPRIAARLDVMQVSDVVAIDDDGRFSRPIYAGNAIQTVRSHDATLIATVRATAFAAAPSVGHGAPVETVPVPHDDQRSVFIAETSPEGGRPDLTAASRVVAGGRALGSAEKFEEIVFPLADILSAAIGASRAAVDAGYISNDCQIGQTGRVVAPELYIGIGISGAIQHVAGMKEATTIVAINSDPDAPLLEIADFALIGDLFALVPELTDMLKSSG